MGAGDIGYVRPASATSEAVSWFEARHLGYKPRSPSEARRIVAGDLLDNFDGWTQGVWVEDERK